MELASTWQPPALCLAASLKQSAFSPGAFCRAAYQERMVAAHDEDLAEALGC